jgi:hypothetical protein
MESESALAKVLKTSTRGLATLALALLSACAAIPLSTMWKIRDFTMDEFFAKNPRELRVAVLTDDRLKRPPGDPKIEFRVEGKSSKPICQAFALVPVDPSAAGEAPLERLPPHRRWYAFALSKEGLDAFFRARRELAGVAKPAQFSLNVSVGDLDYPEDVKSAPFRIDLALDRRDGYFTLVKETTMAFTPVDPNVKKKEEPAPRVDCETTA